MRIFFGGFLCIACSCFFWTANTVPRYAANQTQEQQQLPKPKIGCCLRFSANTLETAAGEAILVLMSCPGMNFAGPSSNHLRHAHMRSCLAAMWIGIQALTLHVSQCMVQLENKAGIILVCDCLEQRAAAWEWETRCFTQNIEGGQKNTTKSKKSDAKDSSAGYENEAVHVATELKIYRFVGWWKNWNCLPCSASGHVP